MAPREALMAMGRNGANFGLKMEGRNGLHLATFGLKHFIVYSEGLLDDSLNRLEPIP